MSAFWNPWHGCTKISPGCLHCYVYRIDAAHDNGDASRQCRRTAMFDLPVKRKRGGEYKIAPGTLVYTCFTSDFLLENADGWRQEAWAMMRERSDCDFFFYTKRILRLEKCLPPDWGDGYSNVTIGCTVENQQMADLRLPVFLKLPIRHRKVGVEPMLEAVDIAAYLNGGIESVAVGGESGPEARPCRYEWILDLRRQCVERNVNFFFHQTGSNFIKDHKKYAIPRCIQGSQARKAAIDFKGGMA